MGSSCSSILRGYDLPSVWKSHAFALETDAQAWFQKWQFLNKIKRGTPLKILKKSLFFWHRILQLKLNVIYDKEYTCTFEFYIHQWTFFDDHLVRDIEILLKILIKNADFFMKYAFERTEISWKKCPKMCQKSVFFTLLKWKSSEFCHGSFLGQFTRAESLKKRCLFFQILTWMVTSLVETGVRTFGTHLRY